MTGRFTSSSYASGPAALVPPASQLDTRWLMAALALAGLALMAASLLTGSAMTLAVLGLATSAGGMVMSQMLAPSARATALCFALGVTAGLWGAQDGSLGIALIPLLLAPVLAAGAGSLAFAAGLTAVLPVVVLTGITSPPVSANISQPGLVPIAVSLIGVWAMAFWQSTEKARQATKFEVRLQQGQSAAEVALEESMAQLESNWQQRVDELQAQIEQLQTENLDQQNALHRYSHLTTQKSSVSAEHIARMIHRTQSINQLVQQSSEQAAQANEAVHIIASSNREVVDVVSSVDEIAFQTNLLALNASVEAARSGDHGRGFAVVATEVRNLALRSAESARQIRKMMEASTDKINHGLDRVRSSRQTAASIISEVEALNEVLEALKAPLKSS